jgi:hypothetical protein
MRAAIGIGITAYPGILKKEFPNNTILENVGFRATSFDGRETMHLFMAECITCKPPPKSGERADRRGY